MNVFRLILPMLFSCLLYINKSEAKDFDPVDYVNPLIGTQSTFELSAGNT